MKPDSFLAHKRQDKNTRALLVTLNGDALGPGTRSSRGQASYQVSGTGSESGGREREGGGTESLNMTNNLIRKPNKLAEQMLGMLMLQPSELQRQNGRVTFRQRLANGN